MPVLTRRILLIARQPGAFVALILHHFTPGRYEAVHRRGVKWLTLLPCPLPLVAVQSLMIAQDQQQTDVV
jgi:hypothetical protein